jgi:hypothetical protein
MLKDKERVEQMTELYKYKRDTWKTTWKYDFGRSGNFGGLQFAEFLLRGFENMWP